MYAGKVTIDKYGDRYVEKIKESDVILCKKCNKYYYPSKNDISVKRPNVYYLYCSICREKNRFHKNKCDDKKLDKFAHRS